MMLTQPQEFARVARQWAVMYAGAPSSDSGSAGVAQSHSRPDPLAKYDISHSQLTLPLTI